MLHFQMSDVEKKIAFNRDDFGGHFKQSRTPGLNPAGNQDL
jgi:hypothetical protein